VFLTAAEVEKIVSAMDEQAPFGTLIRFAAFSGLRSAEIAGLRVRDVNLAAGHIEVRQTVRRVAGEWAVGTPKSARSTRNVPLLNRGLIAELRMLLLSHPDSGNPDALFWPARAYSTHIADWSRPCHVGSIRKNAIAHLVESLGMPPMRFHDLRHTYASLMFAAGFKPYEVSRWIGHASVATTDSIYAHLYPSDYTSRLPSSSSL
jgi:integrase